MLSVSGLHMIAAQGTAVARRVVGYTASLAPYCAFGGGVYKVGKLGFRLGERIDEMDDPSIDPQQAAQKNWDLVNAALGALEGSAAIIGGMAAIGLGTPVYWIGGLNVAQLLGLVRAVRWTMIGTQTADDLQESDASKKKRALMGSTVVGATMLVSGIMLSWTGHPRLGGNLQVFGGVFTAIPEIYQVRGKAKQWFNKRSKQDQQLLIAGAVGALILFGGVQLLETGHKSIGTGVTAMGGSLTVMTTARVARNVVIERRRKNSEYS
jgi:hypothetical protein